MAEELRVFVRIGLFAGGLALVYWLVSYEEAGSVMLAAVAVAAAVLVGACLQVGRAGAGPGGGPLRRLRSIVGFDEPHEPPPLEIEDEPIAEASVWPILCATGALLAVAGLVFGAWLWLPGVLLGAASGWGWATELDV